MKTLPSLITVFCGLIAPALVHAKTINIDFGDPTNLTSLSGWNNIIPATYFQTPTVALVDSTASSSGYSMTITSPFNTSTANTAGHSDASGYVLGLPNSATQDSLFGNVEAVNGQSNITPILTFSGLDKNSTYTFTIYSFRDGVSDTRSGTFSVVGLNSAQGDLNASNNTTQSLVLTNITPDSSGSISFSCVAAPDNNSSVHGFYLNALVIQSTSSIPEPGTCAALAGLAVIGFGAGARRRVRPNL